METVSDWVVLGCAAGAAALSTYLFFGAYHYQWRQVRDKPTLPVPGCGCECCTWESEWQKTRKGDDE